MLFVTPGGVGLRRHIPSPSPVMDSWEVFHVSTKCESACYVTVCLGLIVCLIFIK